MQIVNYELRHQRIIVLEEAEVGIYPRKLMWKVRKLSDLEELFFFHLT